MAVWCLQRTQCLSLLLRQCNGDLSQALRAEAAAWRHHGDAEASLIGDCEQYCYAVQCTMRWIDKEAAAAAARDAGGGEAEPLRRATDPAAREQLLTYVSMQDLMSEAARGTIECPECGAFLVSFAVQRRSADEAPNTVRLCNDCGYRREIRG